MNEINLQVTVKYHQFLNVDDTKKFLEENGLKLSQQTNKDPENKIQIFDRGVSFWATNLSPNDYMEFYKNDFIFIFNTQNLYSFFDKLINPEYFIYSQEKAEIIISKLKEAEQKTKPFMNCPLSLSSTKCKALEEK